MFGIDPSSPPLASNWNGFTIFAVVVGFITLVLIVPVIVATNLTIARGRGAATGILLGVILGWVGVAVAAVLSPRESDVDDASTLCRECPYCKEAMRRDASVCPHCRMQSTPWLFEHEHWFTQDDAGNWIWLDEETGEWSDDVEDGVADEDDKSKVGDPGHEDYGHG